MTRKNKLQGHILEYKRRREKLRKQYPNWRSRKAEHLSEVKEYAEKANRILKTIRNLGRRIRRIEESAEQIKLIAKAVCDFVGVDTIWQKHLDRTPDGMLAKKIFCKYAIEQRINIRSICEYLNKNTKSNHYATQLRMRFTRSFKTNKKNHETYTKFRAFINTYFVTKTINLNNHETKKRA